MLQYTWHKKIHNLLITFSIASHSFRIDETEPTNNILGYPYLQYFSLSCRLLCHVYSKVTSMVPHS